jgi:hypothetical protein
MAYSMKKGGKEVGPASVYAPPHTMDGKPMKGSSGPNQSKLDTLDIAIGAYSKSAGDEQVKTTGIQTRGNGCATKGTMARGPMA